MQEQFVDVTTLFHNNKNSVGFPPPKKKKRMNFKVFTARAGVLHFLEMFYTVSTRNSRFSVQFFVT